MSFQLPQPEQRPIAVLGGGVIGRRIAAAWASAGFDVNIRDPDQQQLADAVKYWDENKAVYPVYLGTSKSQGTIKTSTDLKEAVSSAWLVIEAIPEKLELKIDTFAELENVAPSDAILASNSSSFRSSQIVTKVTPATKRRVLNLHYQMPPEASLVELMSSGSTDSSIFPFLTTHLRACGLHPVTVSKESTGFLFNRLWAAVKREALSMLAEGVSDPSTIDYIWKKSFNTPSGPCELMDAVGLDTVSAIESTYAAERHLPTAHTVDFLQREYISRGRLGKKSPDGGFYPALGLDGTKRSDAEPTLYFLDIGVLALADPMHGGRVIAARADGTASRAVINGQSMPDGVDIDGGRVYWSNMGKPSANDGSVQSARLDGTDVRAVIAAGAVHTPKQVMLDKREKKLYVSDREGMRVLRCAYDGAAREVLWRAGDPADPAHVADQTRHCVGMAVDSTYFYWTQKGAPKSCHGRIFRAPKAATIPPDPAARHDVQLLFENLPEPIDLEVDEENGFLYWTDRGELPVGNSINRVALKDVATGPPAEHKHEILVRNMHEAIGLKLDVRNGHMYSTDMGGTVYRFNLDGSDRRKMYDEQGAYTGIAISYGE